MLAFITMDFFQAQDNARKKSARLVFFYIAAVIAIIATIYFAIVFGMRLLISESNNPDLYFPIWQPEVFIGTAGITIAVIGLGSLFKTLSLRSGGGVVARSLGGQLVSPNTSDPQRRRLVNIVEEMSIAAGVRMPEVYVLPEEGINAFAAGYSPDDAAVAVTQGALDSLSRDELQGVVAHEFSHILNGDMRLNIRLIGLLFGILLLTIIGRVIVRIGFSSGGRSSKNKSGGVVVMALLGLALIIIGYIGVIFGRLIQAAVSRQREFLADASAVQFTRNPDGIAGALKKIGAATSGSRIESPHATETSHMYFASALRSSFGGAFATHPPLDARIKAIDPSFDGNFKAAKKTSIATEAAQTRASANASHPPRVPGTPPPLPAAVGAAAFLAAIASAEAPDAQKGAEILAAIPEDFREAARDPERARAVLLATLYDKTNAEAAAKQDAAVARALSTTERVAFIDLVARIETVPSWTRIALGDLALSAIRHVDARLINATIDAVDAFIEADGEVSLHEYALRKVIHRNLRPPGNPGVLIKACAAVADEIALILSAAARAGSSAEASQQHAFETGASAIRETQPDIALSMASATGMSAKTLTRALDRLDICTPAVKRTVINALVRTISDDGKIEVEEQNLLRAIAAALNCPAPVLVE
ncbi:M48 family metallopeptidase [Ereboglobus luteus]|uniref:Peptidase M48 domain-containing protein n=1 Tax=Ereboglobus luteus TaxID=1796921 RepID=A0A2U8E4M9_9BACT|nr:M48 family metallopeptidase [Ereboglobus luteus]AWI09898.1 hypothetical protein CKA38_12135 [Ereboglobus luteus]